MSGASETTLLLKSGDAAAPMANERRAPAFMVAMDLGKGEDECVERGKGQSC